jgi:myo-inositol-1(or 4)-monophosphatase
MTHFGKVDIEYKGEVDVVTAADRESEKLIVERIASQFPTHDIVGEEGARQETGAEFRWYIDPLDGTTNFAHGFPVFCVSMGLERNGELVLGVVYDPTRNEMFTAEKGSGAFCNDARMQVSKTPKVGQSILATGFPSQKRHKNPNIHFYHHLTLKSHGLRRAGSAAIDLTYTAAGRFDGYWEFNLNMWDCAAGIVLVQEAGGKVTDFTGGKWSPKEVLASNGLIHEELMKEFADMFAGRGMEELPDPVEYGNKRSF